MAVGGWCWREFVCSGRGLIVVVSVGVRMESGFNEGVMLQ